MKKLTRQSQKKLEILWIFAFFLPLNTSLQTHWRWEDVNINKFDVFKLRSVHYPNFVQCPVGARERESSNCNILPVIIFVDAEPLRVHLLSILSFPSWKSTPSPTGELCTLRWAVRVGLPLSVPRSPNSRFEQPLILEWITTGKKNGLAIMPPYYWAQ